ALQPRPDVVFNALHGRWGEDGNIQAVLNILGIPYTHSGVLASAVAMDKAMAKKLFEAEGIPCPPGEVVSMEQLRAGAVMEPPYVIKPVDEGSSVGVHIVQSGDNNLPLDDLEAGRPVLVEKYIVGREFTVSVMGDRALAVTELRPHEGFYDYAAKYTDGKTTHLCPAPVSDDVARLAMEYAVTAHKALGCRGVSRADFRYDDTENDPGDLFMLEVNTQPGMTPLSLVPEQAAHAGIPFGDLMEWMVENAACDS
ncbi:MAG: D-alanine--D-alanine ligase, partial [Alphaproteobacteria bacterium]|nr:D-alanine--D-alanine ligase [Alphaproteobacteria bacterium]